jgi:hypothetical protein
MAYADTRTPGSGFLTALFVAAMAGAVLLGFAGAKQSAQAQSLQAQTLQAQIFQAQGIQAQVGPNPAITAVIRTQLDAFRAGDRQQAYAQASPFIQSRFPNAGIFMEMVTRGYAPLIGPKATDFLPPEVGPNGSPIQPMTLLDSSGRGWMAYYTMEQQADGSWRIAGCQLVPLSDGTA